MTFRFFFQRRPSAGGRVNPWLAAAALAWLGLIVGGCGGQADRAADTTTAGHGTAAAEGSPTADGSAAVGAGQGESPIIDTAPPTFEVAADKLLAARLPIEQTREGWIRLFDGHSFFGWQISGPANWRIEDQAIVVDAGEKSLLCTSVPWEHYELRLEIKADPQTNSGVFLRTPLAPDDPATDCYEVNIAPLSNGYPTGSVVGRVRTADDIVLDPERWYVLEMRLVDSQLTVKLDGETVAEYEDSAPLAAGFIGLQHNSGPVAFRDIRLRPIGGQELIDQQLSHWKAYPEMAGKFTIDDEGQLSVTGGLGQLETVEQFADFVLLTEAKTVSENLNSGIFFRCLPGEQLNGYECQINNVMKDGDPLQPADCGTGGIFRRTDARLIAAGEAEWFSLMLVVHGNHVAAWVNGLQVTDWVDTRDPDPNPRRGQRLEAGTVMLQAHDPSTDVLFKSLRIQPIPGQGTP